MKTAFVSGVTGQDGAYLAAYLLGQGYRVLGGVRRASNGIHHRLAELGVADHIEYFDFELGDQEGVSAIVRAHRPDEFYNLAAQSFVGASWNSPIYTSTVDGLGVLNILEAIRHHSPQTRFYQASTSEMFGQAQAVPQSEKTPFYPRSPYGVAKLFAHWMTKNYRESHGLFAVSGILFNHESPLRGREFVTRKITLGMARVAKGDDFVLELGNLEAKRDWGYAKEYVEGMHRMLQQDEPTDYVLATGATHTVREFVEHVSASAGIDLEWTGKERDEVGRDRRSGKPVVRINPQFYRPAEVDLLCGDASLARESLSWSPQTGLVELATLMYQADSDRVTRKEILF